MLQRKGRVCLGTTHVFDIDLTGCDESATDSSVGWWTVTFISLKLLRGKPLPIRWRERIQQVAVLFLIFFMLFVVVFDIERWISGG